VGAHLLDLLRGDAGRWGRRRRSARRQGHLLLHRRWGGRMVGAPSFLRGLSWVERLLGCDFAEAKFAALLLNKIGTGYYRESGTHGRNVHQENYNDALGLVESGPLCPLDLGSDPYASSFSEHATAPLLTLILV
jgi:hypothetical protein